MTDYRFHSDRSEMFIDHRCSHFLAVRSGIHLDMNLSIEFRSERRGANLRNAIL